MFGPVARVLFPRVVGEEAGRPLAGGGGGGGGGISNNTTTITTAPTTPSTVGGGGRFFDCSHHHTFVVEYEPGKDLGLDMHTDASDVTFNACLGREFTGGLLVFCGLQGDPSHRRESLG